LGSNRYDFYRVALDEFLHHPLVGIGADNFQQQYLAHGRSDETPRYPHSVEVRALAETGLVGSLLAIVGLGAALLAAARALRHADPLARSVTAAALAGFAYWVVHGSFDWFWEFAGLGAPAFAMLGLACALAPARRAARPSTAIASDGRGEGGADRGRFQRDPRSLRGRLGIAVGLLAAILVAASLAAPWLSQLEIQSAARIWAKAPQTAYSRLHDAARLDPLSDEADLVAGSIALRYGELSRAEHDFRMALRRTPGDAYATLELGAIASARGDRASALGMLERAVRLTPRDPLARQAVRVVRAGRRLNVYELNRLILLKAGQLA
jgi:tetratricopeptide (TPR) repeat protein